MINFVEDRDLWRFRLPETKAYHAAMSTFPMTFKGWSQIEALSVRRLVEIGEGVNRFIQIKAESYADHAVERTLRSDLRAMVVQCPVEFVSECGNILVNRDGPDIALLWRFDHERRKYVFSLRGNGTHDVSLLASEHGGGGHEKAAGFELDTLPSEWT